jgi:hypothetical protein
MSVKMYRVDYRYLEEKDFVIGRGIYIEAQSLSEATTIAMRKKREAETIEDVYLCSWFMQK